MAGRHTYNSYVNASDDPFTAQIKAVRDGNVHPAELEEKREYLKAAALEAEAADPNTQKNIIRRQNADMFLAVHPEVNDTTANGQQLRHELMRMFGDVAWTFNNYETAAESLRTSNLLGVNKVEAEKQRKAALRQSAEQIRAAQPTLEDLYTMPMEDLRRLGNG
jgi:hypothetical protein